MVTLRPADANEVAEAWRFVMQHKHGPACFILSRQALPTLDRTKYAAAEGLHRGAYVLRDSAGGPPEVIMIATGSEVGLIVDAQTELDKEGIRSRIVSMPSWELFEEQNEEYRHSVLPPQITARVTVEQAAVMGWDRYAGPTGTIIGMHSFGASAPASALMKKFGFVPEKVVEAARAQARGVKH
jgi:transketolase